MTWPEARDYLIDGNIIGFFNNKPAGQSCSDIFKGCITYAKGQDLDDMIGKCLLLPRLSQTVDIFGNAVNGETDELYRDRGSIYSVALDVAYVDFLAFGEISKDFFNSTVGECFHQWQTYHGLKEKYEYCSTCNRKKD